MPGPKVPIAGPKKTKSKRPPVNGISIDGSQKAMTRMSGKLGFGYQGAMLSARGR